MRNECWFLTDIMSNKRKLDESYLENISNEQANSIICADEYAVGTEKYGCHEVPDKLKNRCYGGSDKRRRVNCCNAFKIMQQWQESGIPERARNYLFWNHPEMSTYLEDRDIIINLNCNPTDHTTVETQPAQSESDDGELESETSEEEQMTTDESEADSEELSIRQSFSENEDICDGNTDDKDSDNSKFFLRCYINPESLVVNENLAISGIVLSLLDGGVGVHIRKQKTLRDVLLLIKSVLSLSDHQMTKIIQIFNEERPEMNYEDLPRDGKNLSKALRSYMKGHGHIRKVTDGLSVNLQKPINGELSALRKRKIPKTKDGDVADFSIQESIFSYGPGMVHTMKHRRILQRVNAANPTLLSPALLKTANEGQYNKEKINGLLHLRPPMNYFALKLHADGVQVVKNGRKPQAIPILAAIDSIAPYDPATKTIDERQSVRLPIQHVRPFIVSFYHGSKKPDQYQFLQEVMNELVLLDPEADVPIGKERLCVAQVSCVICDSPMKSWMTGTVQNTLAIVPLLLPLFHCREQRAWRH